MFSNCTKLQSISIPISVNTINDYAFGYSDNVKPTVYCYHYSYAEQWAKGKGLAIIYLDDLDFVTNGVVKVEKAKVYLGENLTCYTNWMPKEDGLTAQYTSSNPSVIEIDANGQPVPVGVGKAKLTLTVGGKSASATIQVLGKRPTQITLPTDVYVPMLQTKTFTLETVEPEDAYTEITWSCNENYATIDENGLLQLKNLIGTFEVTATDYSGLAATCTVHAISPVSGLTLSDYELVLKNEQPVQIHSYVKCGSQQLTDQYVTWTSKDPTVATVSEDGVVTPVNFGTTEIVAEVAGYKATCAVEVIMPVTEIQMPSEMEVGACRTENILLEAKAVTAGGVYGNDMLVFSGDQDDVARG